MQTQTLLVNKAFLVPSHKQTFVLIFRFVHKHIEGHPKPPQRSEMTSNDPQQQHHQQQQQHPTPQQVQQPPPSNNNPSSRQPSLWPMHKPMFHLDPHQQMSWPAPAPAHAHQQAAAVAAAAAAMQQDYYL